MTPSTVERVFHALGDPTRRAILERLSKDGPAPASQFAGPVTLTAVGQHLKLLEECGLVRTEKIGRVRTCSFNPAGLNVLDQWIRDQRSLWERRLDRLAAIIDEEEE